MSTELQTWTPDKISLIQRTIAPSVSKDEFELFIARCKQTGLDPIARQIYAISRYDAQVGGNKMSIQVSIDGMRLLAERSGKYAGQLGPLFCGEDGKEWHEVWTAKEPPYAAKVGILRSDFQQPLWSVAKYAEYVQRKKDGAAMGLWAKMPDLMLAKCAESLALRRAFPYETSGLYTREEMAQADNEVIEGEVHEVNDQPKAAPGTEHLLNGDGSPAFPEQDALQQAIAQVKREFEEMYPDFVKKTPEWFEHFQRTALGHVPSELLSADIGKLRGYLAKKRGKATSGK